MMFNNLIESSSHSKEYKRRGSFFLLTTITYALLLSITGVASIYAYDAHLETQSTELEIVMFVPPPSPEEVVPEVPRNTIRPAANETSTTPIRSTRTELIDSPSNPNNPPKEVGTIASSVPPARSDSEIGRFNADPVLPTGARTGVPNGEGEPRPNVVMADPPPPPPPPPANKVTRVTKEILKSKAISLPKPNYPPLARQIRLQGTVNVQVLIDETGRVISAQPLEGPPLLIHEAKKAALQARFSPTMIGDQPVKVSGVITYNFQLQ